MSVSANELVRELAQLQRDFRTYAQSGDFHLSELWSPKPNGFVEKYRQRTKEIQDAISRMALINAPGRAR